MIHLSADRGRASRVVLYRRDGCHLCDDARAVVLRVVGPGFAEIDVDADPDLRTRYGDEVPVVTVDGAQIGFWRIEESRLRTALT